MNHIKSIKHVAGHNTQFSAAIGARTYQTIARPLTRRVRVMDVSTCCTIAYVGSTLGHARLLDALIGDGVLHIDGMPRADYRAHFVVVASEAGTPEVLVTPEGQRWIARAYPATKLARKHHRRAALQ
jgi:hypothetical protein